MPQLRLVLTNTDAKLVGNGLPQNGKCRFDLRRYDATEVRDFVDQHMDADANGKASASWPIDGIPVPSAWVGTVWLGDKLLTTVARRV